MTEPLLEGKTAMVTGAASGIGRAVVWDASAVPLACPAFLASRRLTPGAPERFGTDAAPAEILGDSLPPGHYYFSALLSLNRAQFDIDAGELDLSR